MSLPVLPLVALAAVAMLASGGKSAAVAPAPAKRPVDTKKGETPADKVVRESREIINQTRDAYSDDEAAAKKAAQLASALEHATAVKAAAAKAVADRAAAAKAAAASQAAAAKASAARAAAAKASAANKAKAAADAKAAAAKAAAAKAAADKAAAAAAASRTATANAMAAKAAAAKAASGRVVVVIAQAQNLLNSLGARLVVDGKYGPKTAAAWSAAARARGVDPWFARRDATHADVSEATKAKLLAAQAWHAKQDAAKAAAAEKPIVHVAPADTSSQPRPPEGYDPVKASNAAADVARNIVVAKYDYSRPALKAWQRTAGIAQDGIYGRASHAAMTHFLGPARTPRALFAQGVESYPWGG